MMKQTTKISLNRTRQGTMMKQTTKPVDILRTRQSLPGGIQPSCLSTIRGWEFSLLRSRPHAFPPYLGSLVDLASARPTMLTLNFDQTRFRHALPEDDGRRISSRPFARLRYRQTLLCPAD